jgi:hypothetical protein
MEDALKLKGICENDKIRKYAHATIVNAEGYLPDNLEIKRSLLKLTYPVVTVRNANGLQTK